MYRLARLTTLMSLALAGAAACRRNRPVAPAPATVAAPDTAAERMRREAAAREAAERQRAEDERLRREREAAERARAAARSTLEAPIFFAFDRSELEADARTALDAKLPILQANTGVRIRVAGHTDERGSDEYNLALGQRRAAAAKRFLTQRGIDSTRIEIASFGEERPACTESEERCWSRSRRDEFTITVGTVATVLPPNP